MKASVSYKTLDNITVVMLAFKNFKHALSEEFCLVNNQLSGVEESKFYIFLLYILFKAIKIYKVKKVVQSATLINIPTYMTSKVSKGRLLLRRQSIQIINIKAKMHQLKI